MTQLPKKDAHGLFERVHDYDAIVQYVRDHPGMPMRAVAKALGCGAVTLCRARSEAGLPIRKTKHFPPPMRSDWESEAAQASMRQMYREGTAVVAIAHALNYSERAVYRVLKKGRLTGLDRRWEPATPAVIAEIDRMLLAGRSLSATVRAHGHFALTRRRARELGVYVRRFGEFFEEDFSIGGRAVFIGARPHHPEFRCPSARSPVAQAPRPAA